MVQVTKGVLLKCSDTAIKEFIRYLDEKQLLGKRFIIKDLDDHHLFISEGVANHLQGQLDDLMLRNSYSEFSTTD
ncbi:PREDICTED: general transcription factor IIH subunit 5-like [Amphimedon queenslandica]|uniref:General transcription and DNA repair factor IIH subunit TFB5 n=1 Tax=Amphimedon queenslandica TaxID=400682 RepID=A0A1X7U3Z1_AMPQE|nr:PREDICTED: general transcription factor IIH subunit 5-like [Amphimedon queenslandica]|eukprot:XP_011406083.1 PREDICTED: general transcription factor IIH subunit 5-like [Amphimedon queenslandica]